MKKGLKALVALIAASAMTIAGAVAGTSAMADETSDTDTTTTSGYTITIDGTAENQSYKAYPVFTGTLSADASTLSDVQWGSGVNSEAALSAINTDMKTSYTSAAEVANALSSADASTVKAYAKIFANNTGSTSYSSQVSSTNPETYTISVPQAGYYLVVTDTTADTSSSAVSSYMLTLAGNVTITPKATWPTLTKQVQDETADADTNADANGWGASADHAIGESFKFKLTATLPADENRVDYDTYKLVFNDTMSSGITFEGIDSVTVNGTNVPASTTDSDNGYTITAAANQAGGDWTLTIPDVFQYETNKAAAMTVVVTYNAHLNESAETTSSSDLTNGTATIPNDNTAWLDYSNNPHADGMGTTAKVQAYVATYTIKNTKVDGSTEKPLSGAQFKLADSTGNPLYFVLQGDTYVKANSTTEDASTTITSLSDGSFNIAGLDAGTYTLTETKAPDGYNLLDGPITVTIGATHTTDKVNLSTSQNMANTVKNTAGSVLPSTGGMGTRLIYIGGGLIVLVAIAGIALSIKRKHTA